MGASRGRENCRLICMMRALLSRTPYEANEPQQRQRPLRLARPDNPRGTILNPMSGSLSDQRNGKSVLVTGCSSGIGRATALALDRAGFRVYAGVRREADARELREVGSVALQPVILDVTVQEQIEAVVTQLQEEHSDQGVNALVNVAGIASFEPIEALAADRLRRIFEVNFFGPLILTQKMIPLLRKSSGRIVNVGSVGGHTTIPFGFSVCSSKHALESLTSGLRQELAPWGIHAIAVDPSSVATHGADGMVEQVEATINESFSAAHRGFYEKAVLDMAISMHEQEMNGAAPEAVGRVIIQALTARHPKARYRVGPHAGTIILLSRILPDRLFDRIKLRLTGIKMEKQPTSSPE